MSKESSKKPPAPPSPAEITQQSIQAQTQSLPQILHAQEQYGGQFTEQELNLIREFAPQFLQEQLNLETEFGPQFSAAARETLGAYAPERIKAQDLLTNYLSTPDGMTDQETALIQDQSRAAQSARGLAETGFGAVEEVRALADFRRQIQAQQLQIGLALAGQVPTNPIFATQIPNVSPGQLVSNVTPSDIFGLTNNVYNTQAQIAANNASNRSDILGALIGAVGTLGGAAIGSFAGPAGTVAGAQLGGAAAGAIK